MLGMARWRVPDVQDLDLPEGGHMGDETVDAGADVHMPHGVVLKDLSSDVKILIEVVFRENPAFLVLLLNAGEELSERKTFPGRAGLTPDLSIFLEKDRHPLQIGEKGHPLDDDPETHDDSPLRPVDADDVILHNELGAGMVPADEFPDFIQRGEPILLPEKS